MADEALLRLGLDRHIAVLTLTHDPKIDDQALSAALRSDCFYIGALGSPKSHTQRLERLVAMGFTDADLARLHVPIGIDFGAVSPAGIAISILDEIIVTLRYIGRTSEPRNLTRRVTDRQIIQPDWIRLSSFIHIIGFPPVTAMVAPET
jgi:xanthine dehydrogenase accessory factor